MDLFGRISEAPIFLSSHMVLKPVPRLIKQTSLRFRAHLAPFAIKLVLPRGKIDPLCCLMYLVF